MREKFAALLKVVAEKLGKKVMMVIVGAVFATIKTRYPEAPLPSVDLVVDGVAALLLTHTITDVAHIVSTFVGEWLRETESNA